MTFTKYFLLASTIILILSGCSTLKPGDIQRIEYDEFEDVTVIRSMTFELSSGSDLEVGLANALGGTSLVITSFWLTPKSNLGNNSRFDYMEFRFWGNNWIGYEKLIFRIDGQNYEFIGDVKKDVINGGCHEAVIFSEFKSYLPENTKFKRM